LDTVRLNSGSIDEAYIGVRIARTGIAGSDDVILPEFGAKWIKTRGIAPIDLTPRDTAKSRSCSLKQL
jgi:hypothetical protein